MSKSKKERVLDEVRTHGNIKIAADRVGVSRGTIYHWRRSDAVFDAGIVAAIRIFKEGSQHDERQRL